MMNVAQIGQAVAAGAGLIIAPLVVFRQRFGPNSARLALFLIAGAAGPALVPVDVRLSVSALLAAALSGLSFSWTMAGNRRKKWHITSLTLALAALVAALFLFRPSLEPATLPAGMAALGPAGYAAALYLILISVLALAALEQILRTADERVRWEIKFLILGLGAAYAALIYVGSKILLYPPRYGLLPTEAFQVFAIVFPFSCLLIFLSWRRGSGRSTIAVSQGLVYSSITLLGVGIYLIASSLIARWVSQWGQPGVRTEAAVFILSLLALGTVLLTTQFRHCVRSWIRRHVFAGRYDYRRYWMEAIDKIRSVDDPKTAATALARIIQDTLGSIDVGVWQRTRNPDRLVLLDGLGSLSQAEPGVRKGLIDRLVEIKQPLGTHGLATSPETEELRAFTEATNAELLVPLVSSNRLVGLLTVGPNRSGQPFGAEEREFLRVLAAHAAGEFHKAELLDTLVQAREAQAFSNFAAFVLHDLKNFATTLSMIAGNAARYQDNPQFQRDAFESVHQTAEKMKRLCNSLRFFSGPEQARKEKTSLNDIVRHSAARFREATARSLELDLRSLPRIALDREGIATVLQNLLLNAHQATPAEGTISLRTCYHDGCVELSVTDTGQGMPEQFLKNELFLPFHTTKSDGLGIGLFQCKKIIEAHGGTIKVESRPMKGTTVTVTIPAAGDNQEHASQ